MLAGRYRSRRFPVRSLAQPVSVAARRHGLELPASSRLLQSPSLKFLLGESCHNHGRNLQIQRRLISTTSYHEASDIPAQNEEDVDDYGEWSTITALESSRRSSDWRNQLLTQAQLEKQSNLLADRHEDLLIDLHGSDFELWQELFFYRLRIYGPQGISVLWQPLLSASREYTTRLWELPRLWRELENLAVNDDQLLKDLIGHITNMRDIYADKPDGFYERIITDKLADGGHQAVRWHQLLSVVYPDKREVRSLFRSLSSRPTALERFKEICFKIPSFSDMYSHTIPLLTQKGMLAEALEWHDVLLTHGDHPASFEPAERLLRALRKQGSHEMVYKVARELTDLGLADGKRWLRFGGAGDLDLFKGVLKTLKSSEVLLQRSRELDGEIQPVLKDGALPVNDSIAARLFATSMFSIDVVARGLYEAGCTFIGPLAFREAILRVAGREEPGSSAVSQTVELLTSLGITATTANFSTVVLSLAARGEDVVLIDLLRSEEHPEALGNLELQQNMLLEHLRQNDQAGINRTLEIIKSLSPTTFTSPERLANWSLHHAVTMGDQKSIVTQLDRMFAKREKVDNSLFLLAFNAILQPRRPGHKPKLYSELDTLIKFLIMRTRIGHMTSDRQWKEVILRLGFSNQMAKLEQLCIWLVRWNKDPAFRRSSALGAPNLVEESKRDIFLQKVFNINTIQGLLKWGSAAALSHLEPNEPVAILSGSETEKREKLSRDTVLLGLNLLKQLRDLGLKLADPTKDVTMACEVFLVRQFGTRRAGRRINTHIRNRTKANILDYAAAMEMIWGEKLFPIRTSFSGAMPGDVEENRLPNYAKWLTMREATRQVRRREFRFSY